MILMIQKDLCMAALTFASDTLKEGGHFVCKFYQGAEDRQFEGLLKKMFGRVCREKPESSRSVSLFSFLFSFVVGILGVMLVVDILVGGFGWWCPAGWVCLAVIGRG
jgi:hypothetical protein